MVSSTNLFIYVNHLKNVQENIRDWLKDLLIMEIPELIIQLESAILKKNLLKWLSIMKRSLYRHSNELDITVWIKKTIAKYCFNC